ncbi:MAG: aspartate kinase [Bacteroidota bacterium]
MKVFKFGGASVKDAKAIKNLLEIVSHFKGEDLVMVISAMGKTTNALEKIIALRWEGKDVSLDSLNELFDYHDAIVKELFHEGQNFYAEFDRLKSRILRAVQLPVTENYDFEYDRIIHFGEILSTTIVSNFLNDNAIENNWLDARKIIRTNNNYREAKVDWETSASLVKEHILSGKYVIQGFIGHTSEGYITTLGREGSDFTAGILAYCLDAESVSIWKDVPGMLNADPKYFDEVEKLEKISYREALELSYYGASVIHPKTIKPLRNKNIPLYVRSFLNINEEGTVIQESSANDTKIPSFIFKVDQVLISISTRDFSFVVEENLEEIFGMFNRHKVKINMMQNSALNFSVCSDNDPRRMPALIDELKSKFSILYNEGMELVTIRHYNSETIERVTLNKRILVRQLSRRTARMVMADLN